MRAGLESQLWPEVAVAKPGQAVASAGKAAPLSRPLSHANSLFLSLVVVTMRSKELKTSRFVLMLILSMTLSLALAVSVSRSPGSILMLIL